ncbi:Uncharacterised protein [Shigella sonnei]|nr:Uncharacterised protein [Shigella sonnei]CSF04249.1 Uncharacterised protein [Shigella sonnei]CSF16047.1 Uncharacterised protein [Shigella sonnei]
MFKAHLPYSGAFPGNIRFIQRFALDAITHGKSAVRAVVSAKIGKIKRDVETNCVAKSLTGQTLRPLGQWFQIATGGWR